jgi:hypothetical protein
MSGGQHLEILPEHWSVLIRELLIRQKLRVLKIKTGIKSSKEGVLKHCKRCQI